MVMRKVKALGLAVCVAAMPAMAQAGQNTITVETGTLQGHVVDGVESWLGFPYATPPVGPLRWRAPRPAKPWSGVFDAKAFGHDCMQLRTATALAPVLTEPSEDCLTMNVWRPAASGAEKLPVLVYIYGGGFARGGSSSTVYDGSEFAKQGIVVVSFNYRVGRLGFFGHPALSAETGDEAKGNYGFMDQIAALKWVQRNIARFGGDPAKVTIMGESAGGGSVHAMLTSPLTKGLFRGAIIQSGGGRENMLGGRPMSGGTPDNPSTETIGANFAKARGITGTGPAALAALRALPASQVVDLQFGTTRLPDGRAVWGGPTVDGKVVTSILQDAYRSGQFNRVPVMVGANIADLGALNATTMDEALARFPDKLAARKAYNPSGTETPAAVAAKVGIDAMMIEPARFVAGTVGRHGVPAYAFRFHYVPSGLRARWTSGAVHAAELPLVFNTVEPYFGPAAAPDDLRMGKLVNAYWANFVKSGDPNGAGLPAWPRYEPANSTLMQFTAEGTAVAWPDPLKARLDLTAAYADAQGKP